MKVLIQKVVTLTHPDRYTLKVTSILKNGSIKSNRVAQISTANLWDKPIPGFPDIVADSMLSAQTQALHIIKSLESDGYLVSDEDLRYDYPDKPSKLCSSTFQYACGSFNEFDDWSRSPEGALALSKSILTTTKDPISLIVDVWKDCLGTFESDLNEVLLDPLISELNSISAELSAPVRSISVGFVDLHPRPWRILDVIPADGFTVFDAISSLTEALPFTPDRVVSVPTWFYGDDIFEALESPSLQSYLLISRSVNLSDPLAGITASKWVSRFGDFSPPRLASSSVF